MTADERASEPDATAFDETDHDLTTLRRVELRRGEPKSSLAVRFEAADLERLRQRAESEGVGVTQLVRRWIQERLDEPEPAAAVEDLIDTLEQSLRAARAIRRSTRKAG